MELLKSVWRASPQSCRLLFCRAMCAALAGKRPDIQDEPDTVIVCGAFSSSSGLGNGARLYAEEMERLGKTVVRLDVTKVMRMRSDLRFHGYAYPVESEIRELRGKRAVIHANPPQFQLVLRSLGKNFLSHNRIVAYWAWELEEFPDIWKQALDYVDEIEVPSEFVANALRKISHKPVSVHPHALPMPARRKTEYAVDGIIRCLNVFDAGSCWERKNPEAALAAFARAFEPGQARLTFKVTNIDYDRRRFARFSGQCAQIPGVRIIPGTMNSAEMENLYLEHDVYLSLHRSEGFGLPLAEALNYGLHAVATGWSGNVDFMQDELAHVVDYKLAPVTFAKGPCKGLNARWAEADVDEAAGKLQAICSQLLEKRKESNAA